MPYKNHTFVAFGANLPFCEQSPKETVQAALQELEKAGLSIVRRSIFYATPAFPAGSGPDYVNGVVMVASNGRNPADVLALLHRIEARHGRVRMQRWGGRTLDLDLLAAGGDIMPNRAEYDRWYGLPPADQAVLAPDQLVLPHPRLQDRAFVLVPLAEIAPDWVHPVLKKTALELCLALSDAARGEVMPLND